MRQVHGIFRFTVASRPIAACGSDYISRVNRQFSVVADKARSSRQCDIPNRTANAANVMSNTGTVSTIPTLK